MADKYYGVEIGGDKVSVLKGNASTAAKDVEVRITYDATASNKFGVLKCLEQIAARILEDTWPPA